MLRRFFFVGPAGLFVGKLFPAKGEEREKGEDKDDEPVTPRPEKGVTSVPQPVEVYHRDNNDVLLSDAVGRQNLFTIPVPANFIIGDHFLRFKTQGIFTASPGTPVDLIWRIEIDGVGGGDLAQWFFTPTVFRYYFDYEFDFAAKASASTNEILLTARINPWTSGNHFDQQDIQGGFRPFTSAVDMTVARNLTLSCEMDGAADASRAIQMSRVTVESY